MESGGDELVCSRIGNQIAGDLVDDELGERHIAIDRVDHPVAIFPDGPGRVDAIAIRIGIPRRVQPMTTPTFAVMRRGQQPVDGIFISLWRLIGNESLDLLSGWWNAGQVETHT